MSTANDNQLGNYLKDRRERLDPAAFGLPLTRRRTPGLRREEVAQRANVSATWYTWLEQGRGGAPSAHVLERIAHALLLTDVEREHLFLLGLGRPPEVRYQGAESISPRLQGVLDALAYSPAYVKNATWDVVAWNRAAVAVFGDYAAMPPEQRNILRLIFLAPHVRLAQPNWERIARFVVGAFRADVTRIGATKQAEALVDDLCQRSPEFAAIWREHGVHSMYGEHPKQLQHPMAGTITMEYSAFTVDGRPDLSMVVYNPATAEDRERVCSLLQS